MKVSTEKLLAVRDNYKLKYGLWISLEEISFIINEYTILNKAITIGQEPTKQTVLGGF